MKIKQNRTAILKIRVSDATKAMVVRAAEELDLDQSSLVRIAIFNYISHHLPSAHA